jgi:hypothetical protein
MPYVLFYVFSDTIPQNEQLEDLFLLLKRFHLVEYLEKLYSFFTLQKKKLTAGQNKRIPKIFVVSIFGNGLIYSL